MASKLKKKHGPKPTEFVPLVLKEREALLAFLNGDLFQKVLANAALVKPGTMFVGAGTSVHAVKDANLAALMANNRLHEIRGWEMFEGAIFSQAEEQKAPKPRVEETYQNE